MVIIDNKYHNYMGIKGFFKRIFGKKHKHRHFHVSVTFKKELNEYTGSKQLLSSEPITVDDAWCYAFRSMLKYKVLSVSFIDQYDKAITKTYNCIMQQSDRLLFINETKVPEEYGKILMIVPNIEIVGEKKLKVIAEVGDFDLPISGGEYRDFSLIGKTVNFDIKYIHEPLYADV